MLLRRAKSVLGRTAAEIRRSFTERHSARETAGSFSVGVFITMLPTLGTGLLAFVVLAWASDRVNRIAMAASVIVFNPAVKWGVYASSFALGTTLLGPVPGVTPTTVSLAAGPQIVTRLVVGNVILAVVAAAVSYALCLRLVVAYVTADAPGDGAVSNAETDDGAPTAPGDAAPQGDPERSGPK